MTYDLVLKGGRVVTESTSFVADVAVRGERIVALGEDLTGNVEIDARDHFVLPGAIDGHVHLTDPTMVHPWVPTADSFLTGSRAAAIGGVTTLIDFAQSLPGRSLHDALDGRLADAEGQSVVDFGLHLMLRDPELPRLSEIESIIRRGVPSFKLFMVYEGYRMPDRAIFRAMQVIAKHDGLAIVHAENDDIIEELKRQHQEAGKAGPQWHPSIHSSVMEGEAVHRALAMAQLAGARLLLFHLSCKEGIEELRRAKLRGQRAYGEVCPQYLLLTNEVYRRADWRARALQICPPIRDQEHQDTLWKALVDRTVDIISTDHNPRAKCSHKDSDNVPAGTSGIETRLAQMYSFGVRRGRIDLHQWVKLCCSQPARIFGLHHKGQVAPGFDADLVVFDPRKERRLSVELLHSAIDFCTYDGMVVTGAPVLTISRGEQIARDGAFIGRPGRGRFVVRRCGSPSPEGRGWTR